MDTWALEGKAMRSAECGPNSDWLRRQESPESLES